MTDGQATHRCLHRRDRRGCPRADPPSESVLGAQQISQGSGVEAASHGSDEDADSNFPAATLKTYVASGP
jgi:hypothetical protein